MFCKGFNFLLTKYEFISEKKPSFSIVCTAYIIVLVLEYSFSTPILCFLENLI